MMVILTFTLTASDGEGNIFGNCQTLVMTVAVSDSGSGSDNCSTSDRDSKNSLARNHKMDMIVKASYVVIEINCLVLGKGFEPCYQPDAFCPGKVEFKQPAYLSNVVFFRSPT